MHKDYFPLGLAAGTSFCNREAEQKSLVYNIERARPTLIISPRRYGKTSLAIHTLHKNDIPFAHIDLFSELSQQDVERSIIRGIGAAVSRLLSTPERALKAAREFFTGLHIKFSLMGAELIWELETGSSDTQQELKTALLRLNDLAASKQKRIVLFIDEFQRLAEIASDVSTEAVIRHVAQQTKNLVFIFSGSHRHLLLHMFDDRNRPFYKLCEKMTLDRILKPPYQTYMETASIDTWQHKLGFEQIDTILSITERHPYYVNALCSRLWRASRPPTLEEIHYEWKLFATEEKSQMAGELDLLSQNQRKLLIGLARVGQTNAPRSQEFITLVDLAPSTSAQALKVLEQKDFVYCDEAGYYKLIDPLLKHIIRNS